MRLTLAAIASLALAPVAQSFPRGRTIRLPAGKRKAWRYDRKTRVLTASFKRPRGNKLSLRRC